MTRENLADKIAKKTFNSQEFQKSWDAHMQAFGPILEPAFAEDYQTRVHLTAALNIISNRNINGGLKKLKSLQDKCKNDTDKAALLFFMGVCFEMAGQQEQMLECYTYANEYEHGFYLPYLKVARVFLDERNYDKAEENFRRVFHCLDTAEPNEQGRLILSSAYTNYATCMTMMHRYEEAEKALSKAKKLYPNALGRESAEAVLHAIRGNTEQMEKCLETLKKYDPEMFDDAKKSTEKILTRTDPLFYEIAVDDTKITDFWCWFKACEAELLLKLERQEYEEVINSVAEQLFIAFPFLDEQPPYIGLSRDNDGYVVVLHDMYVTAVMNAYEKLLQARQAVVGEWKLRIMVIR